MEPWVPISPMPCMRVVKVLLPASLTRGRGLLCLFYVIFTDLLIADSAAFFVIFLVKSQYYFADCRRLRLPLILVGNDGRNYNACF
jgi:hypothetical protein